MNKTAIRARCRCGNIELLFESDKNAGELPVRACQCSFCRARGVYTTSDPRGRIHIRIRFVDLLERQRFALETADFLICRRCGVYVGAVLKARDEEFAIINLAAAEPSELSGRHPEPVNYGSESRAERIERRRTRWTPVVDWFEDHAAPAK